jgi:hypothetical protein
MTVRGRSLKGGVRLLGALLAAACAVLVVVAAPALADDVTPPEVTSFSLSPSRFDTTSAAQTVTLTVTLTDDLSGVATTSGWGLHLPGSAQSSPWVGLVRISGTPLSGTYIGSVVMPRGSQGGEWLAALGINDAAGNGTPLSNADLAAKFGSAATRVTNTATSGDTTPPKVTAFSLAPSHINTDGASQDVTLTVTIDEDSSGLDQVSAATWPLSTGTLQLHFTMRRVSGDDRHAVYSGASTIPKGSRGGAWGVLLVAQDQINNWTVLYPDDLTKLFGATTVQFVNDAVLADVDAPTVVAFSVTPAEFDASQGEQTLRISVTLADQTGVANDTADLLPMISFQSVSCEPRRISGDEKLGVYESTVTLPRYAKEGIWQPRMYVEDSVGNWRYLETDVLTDMVTDAGGLYAVNTAGADQVTIDRAWRLRTGRSSVLFPAGTVVTRQGGGSFAFYRITAAPFTVDESVPTTDLDGRPVAALMLGIPGLDLSFSEPVTISLHVGDRYDGYRMSVQSLLEGGEAWSDEKTVEVAGGCIRFKVSHATRFAATPLARVTRMSPKTARRGALVTITGRYFGARPGVVRFGAVKVTRCRSWSARRIVCRVPAEVRTGRLGVRVVTAAGASKPVALSVTR